MTATEKKVLIVDDEPEVHEFIKVALREGGYAFLSAMDGQAGLDTARQEAPDLIILDVQMPKKDGFQVFGELGKDENTQSIPVIMLTGVTERTGIKFDQDAMGEFYGKEPDAYIDKPVDPDILKQVATKLLGA